MGARRAPVLQAREELRDPARRRHLSPRAARAAHRHLSEYLYAVAAGLLLVGGAFKLVDPSGTVGALRALGFSFGPDVVRLAAAVELFLGTLALSVSGPIIAALVALSYALFLVIVVLALVRRVPIDSCGCLGRLDTPPSWRHVVVLGLALLGAVGAVFDPDPSLLERITGDGAAGVALLVLVVVGTLIAVGALRMGRQPFPPTSGS